MKIRDVEPLSALEMGFLTHALLSDDRALTGRAKELQERLQVYEAQQEWLKDPVGNLCKALTEDSPAFRFYDRSLPNAGRVQIVYEIERRFVPAAVSFSSVDPRATVPAPRFIEERTYALEIGVSIRELVRQGDDWVRPLIVDMAGDLRRHAEAIHGLRAPSTNAKSPAPG